MAESNIPRKDIKENVTREEEGKRNLPGEPRNVGDVEAGKEGQVGGGREQERFGQQGKPGQPGRELQQKGQPETETE